MDEKKKAAERRVMEVAVGAGLPLPDGNLVEREEPDFEIRTDTGLLGIELTHIHPPPRNKSFHSPVEEAVLYERAVRRAEKSYATIPGALAVKVTTYPWDLERRRGNEKAMARELVEFVRAHAHEAEPHALFERRSMLPVGFGVVSIVRSSGSWFSGGAVTVTVEEIYAELEKRIGEKNKRLPTYRENMPSSRFWLLLYCGAGVTNGIELPYDFDKWQATTQFDRVFFYSGLHNGVYEVRIAAN